MKTRMGRLAPMVAVPAMVLALAGCSGDDEPGGDETSGAAPSGSSTSTDPSGSGTPTTNPEDTTNPDIQAPPRLRGSEGAIDDIDFDPATCKLEEGLQTVRGTLTNSTREVQDYVVTISWSNDTSDVRGQNFTTLENVAPRATVDWALRADVKSGATQCIPNVVRGELRGRS